MDHSLGLHHWRSHFWSSISNQVAFASHDLDTRIFDGLLINKSSALGQRLQHHVVSQRLAQGSGTALILTEDLQYHVLSKDPAAGNLIAVNARYDKYSGKLQLIWKVIKKAQNGQRSSIVEAVHEIWCFVWSQRRRQLLRSVLAKLSRTRRVCAENYCILLSEGDWKLDLSFRALDSIIFTVTNFNSNVTPLSPIFARRRSMRAIGFIEALQPASIALCPLKDFLFRG